MTYDQGKLAVNRLTGSAVIGVSLLVGSSLIGLAQDRRERVPVSTLTLASGYTVGDTGELELDPATGTASMVERVSGSVPTLAAAPLAVNDRIEITYGDVVLFQGVVSQVSVTVEASTGAAAYGETFVRRTTYALRSLVAVMLSSTVAWSSLPAEDPLTRLRRWFTVNVGALTSAQLARVTGMTMPSSGAGSSTYLDLARAFTAKTLMPLRSTPGLPPTWNAVDVLPGPIKWNGVAPTPVLTNTADWARSVAYSTDGGPLLPESIETTTNDDRFLGGIASTAISPALIGKFVIGVDRIGASAVVPFGFRASDVVDVFGTPMVAVRVEQSFGKTYSAAIELAAPQALTA